MGSFMTKQFSKDNHGHSDRSMFDDYVTNNDKFMDLTGKVVAITGTSAGSLGFHLAEIAIRKNAKILLLLNRDSSSAKQGEEGLKEIATRIQSTIHIQTVPCDMQDFAVVRAAGETVKAIAAKNAGLDVLINNAGIMATRDTRTTADGFDVQMQTNQLSHFLLTYILYNSLELAATNRNEARLVTHSSSARDMPNGMLEEKYFVKCGDRKSTRLNSSHRNTSRMPSSA